MLETDTPLRRIFSVSEINAETKKLLEQKFLSVFVQGEVSNFSAPRSGHWYFTIKDASAQIRVVMFKQANFQLKPPSLGDEVVVGGQLSFYQERGEVQIIARQMRPAGLGDLQQQFDALKKKLLEEGLFDKSLKRPLPILPKKVAVITSPTGAVIQDIIQISKRRAKSMEILLVPVRVQGETAAAEISSALKLCNQRSDIDLIVLARGGGSLEDFIAFNSEQVARCIVESAIPVISGVGHETDVSITDFVADHRAATPSEAAELVSTGYVELRQNLQKYSGVFRSNATHLVQELRHRIDKSHLSLKNPIDGLRQVSQKIDHLEIQLAAAQRSTVARYQQRIDKLSAKIEPLSLTEKIGSDLSMLAQLRQRLRLGLNNRWHNSNQQLKQSVGMLEALSPLRTMTRGYSITMDSQNTVISSIKERSVGDHLVVRLQDGTLDATVTKVRNLGESQPD